MLRIRAGEFVGSRTLCRKGSPMAGVGFLQSLWEKPIWTGIWSYLDPMDSVFGRTASMECTVPGKYGPHGELFFFPIQKESAPMPGRETASPFLNADIRTPFFLLMSSRSVRSVRCCFALTRGKKEEAEKKKDFMLLI